MTREDEEFIRTWVSMPNGGHDPEFVAWLLSERLKEAAVNGEK